MKKDVSIFLRHILESIEKIEEFTKLSRQITIVREAINNGIEIR